MLDKLFTTFKLMLAEVRLKIRSKVMQNLLNKNNIMHCFNHERISSIYWLIFFLATDSKYCFTVCIEKAMQYKKSPSGPSAVATLIHLLPLAEVVSPWLFAHFALLGQRFYKIEPISKRIKKLMKLVSYCHPLCDPLNQKYSRLRYLLIVKGLVICFYLGWSNSILQIRTT